MQITISTKQILGVLLVLAWLIFIGICIEAGGYITNAFFALANPGIVPRLWRQVDLSDLFRYNHSYFFVVTLLVSLVSVTKAWLFFLIIRLLHNKKVSIAQPFSKGVQRFIVYLSYVSLLIGLFSVYGLRYVAWLATQGIKMPDTQDLHFGGGDVWLFMAVILFVIAQIFKRGIEIQTENELTI